MSSLGETMSAEDAASQSQQALVQVGVAFVAQAQTAELVQARKGALNVRGATQLTITQETLCGSQAQCKTIRDCR